MIDNMSMASLLQNLVSGIVVTPNVDHIMKLQHDEGFYDTYQNADYVLCDSKIIQFVSRYIDNPIIEKISGSDLLPAFCLYHRYNEDVTIFLLGSIGDISRVAATKINSRIGRQIVVGYCSPSMEFEDNISECQDIVAQINRSRATVLVVGVGAPKQEKWITKFKDQMPNVKIYMAIGATIDFEAGVIQRAPKWMSSIGLEWLYRLSKEPGRLWRRYLHDDMPFFWLIMQQKLGLYRNPWQ